MTSILRKKQGTYGLKTFLGMRLNAEHHSAIYVSTEGDETTAARISFLYDIRAVL